MEGVPLCKVANLLNPVAVGIIFEGSDLSPATERENLKMYLEATSTLLQFPIKVLFSAESLLAGAVPHELLLRHMLVLDQKCGEAGLRRLSEFCPADLPILAQLTRTSRPAPVAGQEPASPAEGEEMDLDKVLGSPRLARDSPVPHSSFSSIDSETDASTFLSPKFPGAPVGLSTTEYSTIPPIESPGPVRPVAALPPLPNAPKPSLGARGEQLQLKAEIKEQLAQIDQMKRDLSPAINAQLTAALVGVPELVEDAELSAQNHKFKQMQDSLRRDAKIVSIIVEAAKESATLREKNEILAAEIGRLQHELKAAQLKINDLVSQAAQVSFQILRCSLLPTFLPFCLSFSISFQALFTSSYFSTFLLSLTFFPRRRPLRLSLRREWSGLAMAT